MFDGILHDRLKNHAGDKSCQGVRIDLLRDSQIVAAEAGDFDIEVVIEKVELLAERHKGFVLAQQAPQNIAELENHTASGIRIVANQRGNGIECVEQKMRIDLRGERVHARLEQQLLVLLEVHLNAGVIPNLD